MIGLCWFEDALLFSGHPDVVSGVRPDSILPFLDHSAR